jgi:hypothetical protein
MKSITQTREAIEGVIGQIKGGADLSPVLKPIYATVLDALDNYGSGDADIARITKQIRQLLDLPTPKKRYEQIQDECEQTEPTESPSNASQSTPDESASDLPTSRKGKSK